MKLESRQTHSSPCLTFDGINVIFQRETPSINITVRNYFLDPPIHGEVRLLTNTILTKYDL